MKTTRPKPSQSDKTELMAFLPMTRAEMEARGWDELDVLLVSGDAYVDHPAFGAAVIGRWLESKGFRVGIIAQPDWRDEQSVQRLGRPRLFVGITAGAVDSMLNLYTAAKKPRSADDYAPGGRRGLRPARATIVYANLVSRAFPGLPVVIGGVEASLRRFVHYDYWDDRIRSSILIDSGADLLVYGMGERAVLEIARRLKSSSRRRDLRYIPGTAFLGAEGDLPGVARTLWLPARDEIEGDPAKLVEATLRAAEHVNPWSKMYLAQRDGSRLVVACEPARPLSTEELDALYDLPFTRREHFTYSEPVPALQPVRFSVTVHRGCYGGCSFCGLGMHQGKVIQSRSVESIVREIRRISELPGFRGIITDLGGPTANMYETGCRTPERACRRTSCLYPKPCGNLKTKHDGSLRMLAAVRSLPEVRHAYVASGVRFDLALLDPEYIDALATHHTGGHLSVAPEHCVPHVLALMGKPDIEVFERFRRRFEAASRAAGKEQYLVPYMISGFPGCTDADMAALRDYLRRERLLTRQVQDFTPTPMTLAAAMFYSGKDAEGRPIPVARAVAAKKRQAACLRPAKGATPRTTRG